MEADAEGLADGGGPDGETAGDGDGLGESASAVGASAIESATTAQNVVSARRGPTRSDTGASGLPSPTAAGRDVHATGFDGVRILGKLSPSVPRSH